MERSIAGLVLACIGCVAPARPTAPRPEPPELANLDVYGSRQLDRAQLIAKLGPRLVELVRGFERGDGESGRARLEADIGHLGRFASVSISSITYYQPERTFVQIELVDEADRAARMSFAPTPKGTVPDPDGLVALWIEYEEQVRTLLGANAIKSFSKCPFWHCITFDHPTLEPFRVAFATRVAAVEAELVRVLREESRVEHRAAAAFLLAHLASGERVVELVLPAIRDPESLVRNNAIRVLALIATEHKQIAIPVRPLLVALRFPTNTDRDKAAAVLAGLVENPGLSADDRALILRDGGDILVDMLAMRNPNDHDWAWRVLKGLRRADLGEHAVAAWRRWVNAAELP